MRGKKMFTEGFIKLKRDILEWRWYSDIKTARLYLHILLTANYDSRGFRDRVIKRGQRVVSIKKLAAETELTEKEVRTALGHLQQTNDISVDTTNKYSIITINNYADYVDTANKGQTNVNKKQVKGQQYNKNNKKKSYDINELKKMDMLDFIE